MGSMPSRLLRELPLLVLVSVVLALLLRSFAIQVFYIPSSSMEPTLQIDDRIVVDKVSHQLFGVDRGDILVFTTGYRPDRTMLSRLVGGYSIDYVKRAVAFGGEEVELRPSGALYVDGARIDEPYLGPTDEAGFGPAVIPDGHVFFLGDNRANSADSRTSLGYIPEEQLVGTARLRVWPPPRAGSVQVTTE